jgi:transcriptional regulator of acetoin/glycerol metabolism
MSDDRPASTEWGIFWVFPDLAGRLTTIGDAPIILGRDPECDVPLPGDQTSRRHAEVRKSDSGLSVRDLGSTNGIFLNGAQIAEAHLKAHDVLRVGQWLGVVTGVDPQRTAEGPLFHEVTPDHWAGPALAARFSTARGVARADLPVIIQGETGSGKDGVARALHAWSDRQGAYLEVNCAALAEASAEGELFGYRKGAFPGADRTNLGHLRAARGGTLVLDRIAELALPVQAKLLRALADREVTPVGETVPIRIEVRVVSATRTPLTEAVKDHRFRSDLLARLDGQTISLPPLRARVEEALFLFSRRLAHHAGGGNVPEIDGTLAEQLLLYDWPSNVRELDLLARRMIALHGDVRLLRPMHLSERLLSLSTEATTEGTEDRGPEGEAEAEG